MIDHKTLPLLVALSVLFSGCLGILEDDPETPEDTDDGQTGNDGDDGTGQNGHGNETGDGNGDGNDTVAPPSASLSANVTEGDAPLAVQFDLDAEHADPESLSWTLDLDGDTESGEGLPATVEHTFEQAGNYTVVFTVTYEDESDEDTIEVTASEAAVEPNALQEGTNGLCLDYNILYAVPGVEDPLAPIVEVAPGTGFKTSSDNGTVWVDFFDADGTSLGYLEGSGTVPEEAAKGILCVDLLGGYPAVPVPLAAWTYQDGFPAEG